MRAILPLNSSQEMCEGPLWTVVYMGLLALKTFLFPCRPHHSRTRCADTSAKKCLVMDADDEAVLNLIAECEWDLSNPPGSTSSSQKEHEADLHYAQGALHSTVKPPWFREGLASAWTFDAYRIDFEYCYLVYGITKWKVNECNLILVIITVV